MGKKSFDKTRKPVSAKKKSEKVFDATKKLVEGSKGKSRKKVFDATIAHESPDGKLVLFWRPPCPMSQWTYSPFKAEDDVEYTCAEQYMMAEKAKLFGDENMRRKILASGYNPNLHKRLGRKVENFVQAEWQAKSMDIVIQGNIFKFEQNEEMKQVLLATGDKTLVEASSRDKIWGIGLRADNPLAHNPSTWRGMNLLGKALMEVRQRLQNANSKTD